MRIDMLITELDVGGAENCFTALAKSLVKKSHKVRVIVLGEEPRSERNRLHLELITSGVELHFLRCKSSIDFFRAKRGIMQLVRGDRPEVALSFLFHANLLTALCYSAAAIPFVVGVRVADPSVWRAWLSKWIYRKSTKIICVSQSVADHVVNEESAPVGKIVVVTNGIEISEEIDAKTEKDGLQVDEALERNCVKQPFLIYVGRYASQKQIELLFELPKKLTVAGLLQQIVMVGDGVLKDQVSQSAAQHPGRLIDLGRRDDVLSLISRAQMLVLPSCYEGMPNVILEAMASRKAVACMNVEGVMELLGERANEQIASDNASATWFALVERLAAAPQLCQELGAANFERCKIHFAIEDKMLAYERVLFEIIEGDAKTSTSASERL